MELDELQIKIDANAAQANKSINNLIKKLLTLSTTLGSVDTWKLNNIATGIKSLSDASAGFKGKSGKASEISSLANALKKFSNIDTSSLYGISSAMKELSVGVGSVGNVNVSGMTNLISSISKLGGKNATQGAKNLITIKDDLVKFVQGMNSIGSLNFDTAGFSSLISSISKLGSKSTTQATQNLPALTRELNNLFTTLSRSPSVSNNIIQMTNALARLAGSGNRSGSAVRSLTGSLNSYHSSATKATKSSKGLVSQIGMFYAKFFLVIRGVKQLWKAIESTTDYIEAFNYQAVAFGKIGSEWDKDYEKYGYDNATAYAESFQSRVNDTLGKLSGLKVNVQGGLLEESGAKNLGLNIQEVTQYASQLASVTNSLGQTGEATTAITKSMTMLAGDISSLFNVDYSTVAQNLQSGLIGQSRALYKYGIDITNATLETYAYNLGISKSVSEMTQMEKQQLRVLAILDQSKVSWGDLANTINSPSNMLRQFSNNMKEVGMVAGQLFIPILSKVMPVVNGVAIATKRLLVNLASLMGIKIDFESFGQSGYKDTSDGLEDISDGYQDVADSAKKATLSLMGFDEINKLQDDTSSSKGSSGGGGSTIDLTDDIAKAAAEYEEVWNKAFANMENSAVVWADRIEKALEPLKKTFQDIAVGDWLSVGKDVSGMATDILKFARNAVKSVNWNEVGDNIGKFLKGIDWLEIFKESIKLKVSIAQAIAEVWFASFDEAPIETALLTAFGLMKFTKVGKLIAEKIGVAVSANLAIPLANAFTSLGGIGGILTMDLATIVGAGSFAEIGLAVATGIIGGIAAAFVGYNIGEEIYSAITGDDTDYDLSDYLGKNFNADDWINGINLTIDDFKTGLGEIKDSTVTWWEDRKSDWKDGMDAIYNNVSEKVDDIRSKWEYGMSIIKTETVNWWEDRKSDWTTGMTTIRDTVKDGMDKVGSKFGGALSSIKTNSSNWWTERKNEWSMGVDTIKNTFSDFWTNHASRWFNSANWNFSGIGDGLSSAFTGAIESVKQIWNRFANWLNDKLTWEIKPVKIMGKTVFEGTTIDLGKIPTFQTGGFPEDGMFFANHNELVGQFSNGKTAVANNDQITAGIERAAYNGMKRALAESNGNQSVNISLEANTAGLFRAVQKEADNYTRRTGESAFVF